MDVVYWMFYNGRSGLQCKGVLNLGDLTVRTCSYGCVMTDDTLEVVLYSHGFIIVHSLHIVAMLCHHVRSHIS